MKYLRDMAVAIFYLLFDAALILGCSYLVFWKEHSGWWFLLVMLFVKYPTLNDGDREDK